MYGVHVAQLSGPQLHLVLPRQNEERTQLVSFPYLDLMHGQYCIIHIIIFITHKLKQIDCPIVVPIIYSLSIGLGTVPNDPSNHLKIFW